MSNETEATSPEPEGLQFDHAEFENPNTATSVACGACGKSIDDQYHEINGVIVCERCRDRIERQLRGGSGFLRFLKAIVLGSAAALVCAAIYFAVMHFLPIPAGLISILCGYLVGMAVRKGSGDRGGWIYQILAIVLTYLTIGVAYTGESLSQGFFDAKAIAQPGQAPLDGNKLVVLKTFLVAISVFIAPALAARADSMYLVILLIALWKAWEFTKMAKLVVSGPYRVGDGGPDIEPDKVAGHA